MARKDEEFYRPGEGAARERRSIAVSREPENEDEPLDERALDLEDEDADDEQFLRATRRVQVRRGAVTHKTANRLKIAAIALGTLTVLGGVAAGLYGYGTGSWRFRIDSSDNLEILGIHNVSHAQVMEVFGGDLGRNIFFVPLEDRKRQLEEIPWVQNAAVVRLLPNHLRVAVTERAPVAFVRVGSKIALIDASGVIMDLPRSGQSYSFPVITGTQPSEPLSTRAARMKTYTRLVNELDSTGAHYSAALSEVDLSDPEDVKATFADPSGSVLVHLGDEHFLDRYKIYLAHVNEWRQQFAHMDSVDLRYDRQVIVNSAPGTNSTKTASAAKKPKHAARP